MSRIALIFPGVFMGFFCVRNAPVFLRGFLRVFVLRIALIFMWFFMSRNIYYYSAFNYVRKKDYNTSDNKIINIYIFFNIYNNIHRNTHINANTGIYANTEHLTQNHQKRII